MRIVLLPAITITVLTLGCSGASGQQAFTRYVECSSDMRTGDAIATARSCFTATYLEPFLAMDDAAEVLTAIRATDLRLIETRSTDTAPETEEALELRVVGLNGDVPTALTVTMQEVDGVWRVAGERIAMKLGALTGSEEGPAPRFQLQADGATVLDSETGVWLSSNALGLPVFVVSPFFDGPEIQIDNLHAATPPQGRVSERPFNELEENADLIGVRYRTPDGPARVRNGELRVDAVEDGRMSGTLHLEVEPGTAGEIRRVEVVLTFSDLPVERR